MSEFDFVVIGSGVAGLSLSLKLAEHGSVAIVTKRQAADSNTAWAQGGVACVTSAEDSFDLHIKDTLIAGAGLCDQEAVRTIITEGPGAVRELMRIGVHFDERMLEGGQKELDLGKEGGHSKRRVLHYHDTTGREFMSKYHKLAALAPRDIVARAIDAEMKRTGAKCMYIDITHKPAAFLRDRFPNIFETCTSLGIDMTRQPIPIVPAAHYQCGGVKTDLEGATTLRGLFAVGEVACTGLHGANRLASNSLLEALVLAARCSVALLKPKYAKYHQAFNLPEWRPGYAQDVDEVVVIYHNWDEIRRLMWDYVGIVRTNKRLQRASTRLRNLQREIQEFYWDFKLTTDLLELRNLCTVASLIVDSALARNESRGLHFTLDYPATDDLRFLKDTILRRY